MKKRIITTVTSTIAVVLGIAGFLLLCAEESPAAPASFWVIVLTKVIGIGLLGGAVFAGLLADYQYQSAAEDEEEDFYA